MEILPPKWQVKIDKENKSIIREYWLTLPADHDFDFKGWLVSPNYDRSHLHYSSIGEGGYTKITFEEFKELVLKQPQTIQEPQYEIY